jgi:membrane-associated phospholipid phosphatase
VSSIDIFGSSSDGYSALLGTLLNIGVAIQDGVAGATAPVASQAGHFDVVAPAPVSLAAVPLQVGNWDIPPPAPIYFNTGVTALLQGSVAPTSYPADHSPVVELTLVHDTGASATDRITNDASVLVHASDDGHFVRLTAQLDANIGWRSQDILPLLDADGSFVLDRAALSGLAGRFGFKDGSHDLTVSATDDHGHTTRTSLHFVLDGKIDGGASVGLDWSSDTGYRGDGRTETAVVGLIGRAEAFATVEVGGIEETADARGNFVIADLMLEVGQHDYAVHVTDVAGNTNTTTLTLTRLENSVVHWNDIVLDAIKSMSTAPMYASRLLAMESVAVYDVVQAVEAQFSNAHLAAFARYGANQEAAIAQAAYDVLTSVYASDTGPYHGSAALRASLSASLAQSLGEVPDGFGEWRGVALGHRIAQQVLAERANDGWNGVVNPATEIGSAPGEWRPTGPGFANPLAPQWGDVAPWMINSADQFLPPPPPALDSAQYALDYDHTMLLGGANSQALGYRTADQTEIALFWADGGGTYTPPGHWNAVAGEIATAEGRTTGEIAALYAKLNMAMADAAIVCWNAKFTYDFWRPVTAIQLGDTDGNAATVADPNWTPLIATPPFPEYTSGHSTFSGAAATILTAEFGSSYSFTTGTPSTDPSIAGVTRSFSSFWAAANEAGESRILGGIHFETANVEGLACGAQIGNWVLQNFGS